MKAMLLTRCGCTRMVDIASLYPEYKIPLLQHNTEGMFRNQATEYLESWGGGTSYRVFKLDKYGVDIQGEKIILYREVGN